MFLSMICGDYFSTNPIFGHSFLNLFENKILIIQLVYWLLKNKIPILKNTNESGILLFRRVFGGY